MTEQERKYYQQRGEDRLALEIESQDYWLERMIARAIRAIDGEAAYEKFMKRSVDWAEQSYQHTKKTFEKKYGGFNAATITEGARFFVRDGILRADDTIFDDFANAVQQKTGALIQDVEAGTDGFTFYYYKGGENHVAKA